MSKVQTVEAIPVSYPEPNDFNALRHLCLVKITTDDGVVGWGESITQFPEANFAVKAIIEGMAERVIGKDPLDNIAIWHAHHATRRGGTATAAASPPTPSPPSTSRSGTSRASCSAPRSSNLLGGAVHEKLPAIASCHAHYEDIGGMVEEAQEWVAPGHARRQGRLRQARQRPARLRARPRRRVHPPDARGPGPDKMIMIDCGWNVKWDVMTAVRRVQAFEEYDLAWIEEPLGAWDPGGLRQPARQDDDAHRLRREGVERRGLRAGARDRHRRRRRHRPGPRRGHHRLQGRPSGIEFYRRQANAHCLVVGHRARAASLAISFSSPAFKLFEFKPLRNPMQHELVTEPFEHVDGWVYPPTRPGLGIEVIEEVVDRYRSEKVLHA